MLRVLIPPPPAWQLKTDVVILSVVLLFPECYILGITQHVACSDWLLSTSDRPSSFLHACPWLDGSTLSGGSLSVSPQDEYTIKY